MLNKTVFATTFTALAFTASISATETRLSSMPETVTVGKAKHSSDAVSRASLNSASAKQSAAGSVKIGPEKTDQGKAQRSSRYSHSSASSKLPVQQSKQSGSAKSKPWSSPSEYRAAKPEVAASHVDFVIHDGKVFLTQDDDGDGYYSKFTLEFDADFAFADYAEVYAELYIRPEGSNEDWKRYYTTERFSIFGTSDDDEFEADTVLNDGYPSQEYELLIDLYEYGYSGIVATLGPNDDFDLADLPLEDKTQEITTTAEVTFKTVQTDLLIDDDDDGFYRSFKVTFDADTQEPSLLVTASLYQRIPGGDWVFETQTDTFELLGDDTEPSQEIEALWNNGYVTEYYDFKIEIEDASGTVIGAASTEFTALTQVPLEDASADLRASPLPPPPPSSSSDGSGGGSFGLMFIAALVGLLGIRQRASRARS